ncbi:glycosyltransferase family 4 protein [Ohtaekwangia sp.]|uniref:glycosyltransferase family 4 protein n=1 Tax=Ohtaekwangia sp. TaxID=2066019 RepID=UPI002F958255
MAARKRIGLIFSFDSSWTGGLYYLLNIIRALKHLPDPEKPVIVIFYKKEISPEIQATAYPALEFLPLQKPASLLERVYIKVRRLVDKNYRYTPQYEPGIVDFVFPCVSPAYVDSGSLTRVRKIFWIADFQHKYLQHFFSEEEINIRDKNFDGIASLPLKLVLSSEDARSDFNKFYPAHRSEVVVMPFATTLPAFEHLSISALRSKYSLEAPYFMSPNQFWAHKNHIVILKAIARLKHKGYIYKVAFTGNEKDYRNPGYAESLKEYARQNGIEEQVRFLGFIDRSEQLQLMKHSLAIIQPSLFEGWSTVIEDAKAMDQVIVASHLNVHKEQCGNQAHYFDPANEAALAEIMESVILQRPQPPSFQYSDRIVAYANQILNL